MPQITVTFSPNAVNGWFLKAASRPIVSVNGQVVEGAWGAPVQVEATAPESEIAAGVRYRWLLKKDLLGPATTVRPGAHLTAANGSRNGAPFELS